MRVGVLRYAQLWQLALEVRPTSTVDVIIYECYFHFDRGEGAWLFGNSAYRRTNVSAVTTVLSQLELPWIPPQSSTGKCLIKVHRRSSWASGLIFPMSISISESSTQLFMCFFYKYDVSVLKRIGCLPLLHDNHVCASHTLSSNHYIYKTICDAQNHKGYSRMCNYLYAPVIRNKLYGSM